MNPIKIRLLNNDISDAYCYAGQIFLATDCGEIYSKSLLSIYSEMETEYVDYRNFLKIALINNDYLTNEQYNTLIFGNIKKKFDSEWKKASKIVFECKLDISSCNKLGKVSGYPIYDLKAYGFHLFVGHGNGVDYFKLNTKNPNECVGQCRKIFDARIVSISAKIGQVLYSAGSEGLFTSSFWNEDFTIDDKSIENTSFRTIWSNWDFANYRSNNEFIYYANKVEKQETRKYTYSNLDEEKSKKRISQIGIAKHESRDLLKNLEYKYVVNNNKYYYIFLKNGEIKIINLIRNEDEAHFSSRSKDIFRNFKKEIISVRSGFESLIIETFDELNVLKNGKVMLLNNDQPLNYRSYLSSIRLRKTISATYNGYSDIYLCP